VFERCAGARLEVESKPAPVENPTTKWCGTQSHFAPYFVGQPP